MMKESSLECEEDIQFDEFYEFITSFLIDSEELNE